MLQEKVDELTLELSEERKALRYSEIALRHKERDLEEALGGYNEKGEELELLTAKVSYLLLFSSLPFYSIPFPSLPPHHIEFSPLSLCTPLILEVP